MKKSSACDDHVRSHKAKIPINANKPPAPLAERATKEEINQGLFRTTNTENTIVIW
jgi:hypothetical protein